MWSEHHLFIPNQCFMNCLRCPWVVAPVSHATTVTGWCATPAQRMASFRGILQKGQQEMKANLCPNDGNTICFWSKKHSLRRKWWLKSWIHHSERDAIFHFHSSPEFVRGPNYGASVWDLQKKTLRLRLGSNVKAFFSHGLRVWGIIEGDSGAASHHSGSVFVTSVGKACFCWSGL